MNVLSQANDIVKKRWRRSGTVLKVFLIIAIIVLSIVALAGLIIWAVVKLFKGLTSGIRTGGDYSLYFPKGRRR